MKIIKKRFLAYLITIIFLLTCFSSLTTAMRHTDKVKKESSIFTADGWYYLPAYPNYAPCGLPDFDQCSQDDWKSWVFFWSLCAPTAVANIFWWFDSKNADPDGFPGDGNDTYPLVKGFYVLGPTIDDHSPTNVNFVFTPLRRKYPSGELIEQIAWYVNNNFRRYYFFRFVTAGTRVPYLIEGVKQWIEEAGLKDQYIIEKLKKPSFSDIASRVQDNQGIILLLTFPNPIGQSFPVLNIFKKFQTFSGHYVSIAGIHPDGYIALSDPYLNKDNSDPRPMEHCNPSIVSHDTYRVNFSSPFPERGSWWLPDYEMFIVSRGAIAVCAIAISEVDVSMGS